MVLMMIPYLLPLSLFICSYLIFSCVMILEGYLDQVIYSAIYYTDRDKKIRYHFRYLILTGGVINHFVSSFFVAYFAMSASIVGQSAVVYFVTPSTTMKEGVNSVDTYFAGAFLAVSSITGNASL